MRNSILHLIFFTICSATHDLFQKIKVFKQGNQSTLSEILLNVTSTVPGGTKPITLKVSLVIMKSSPLSVLIAFCYFVYLLRATENVNLSNRASHHVKHALNVNSVKVENS